ncbi:Heat shock protein 75 kDa, mitochondrial [Stylophora pistillata]|uniref:Heat shock protein 75 kDa, mitochondrial n=1 Tax=Stylophora pistillata TaxID=50429 RepID=A0A2B4SJ34_STYPI|nr:Heat shock protein 75 kDa, mitochondrial [Stylophora pistillata]
MFAKLQYDRQQTSEAQNRARSITKWYSKLTITHKIVPIFSLANLWILKKMSAGFGDPHVRLYPKISCRAFSENLTDKDNFSKEEDFEAGDTVHIIRESERVIGETQRHEFQAETRQLLDIVAKTLYSEKEVFIREIISNASDALEKLQYQFLTGKDVFENELPLEINIATNQDRGTLTIQDYGIGMTEEELLDNLGTIARSGSKAFLEELGKLEQGDSREKSIIGQFGVGFYSTFMVADRVDVFTRSFCPDSKGFLWTSDGSGSFEMAETENVTRGTKVVMHLKDDFKNFSIKTAVEDIIKKYSNFVGFPIYLDGTCINTIQPLWMLDPNAISTQEHEEFYQFIAKNYDKPRYTLHYKTDAPLNIRSIFYIPETVPQLFTMANTECGVSLYSRKVLIQSKADKVLPNWLRFVKGVVDSEDIPLNLSRELLQDSALITKLSQVLESRIVKFLQQQQKKDRVKYENFFKECGAFFREGIVSSNSEDVKQDIAKLLLFESSKEKAGELTPLSVYVSRMKPTQQYVYYLCAPSRELAETSPYYEALKKDDVEVLFTYNEQDEVTLHYLSKFDEKRIMAAENYFSVEREVKTSTDIIDADKTSDSLTDEQAKDLADWISLTLGKEKVPVVKVSKHLSETSHPVMVTVPDMVAAKHWLKVMKAQQHQDIDNTKYHFFQPTLEINPSHDLIKQLQEVRSVNSDLAVMVVHQLLDNAMISAGLLDDPRSMVGRLNSLLAQVLVSANGTAKPE